jgi:hypothetical protein
MENAEMEAIVRRHLAEVEADIRKTVETARRRIRPMADTPDDGRRGIRHEVCDLTWLARELAEQSQEAERQYAVRTALMAVLNKAGDANAVEEDVEED